MNPSRRRFLFTGVAGVAVLVAARWLQHTDTTDPTHATTALSASGADVMRALVPVYLDGALPTDPIERRAAVESTVSAIAVAIDGLPPVARDELATLFALLAFAPLRFLFAGIDGAWRNASRADAQAFLVRLQKSRWSLKRAAYDALHQLTMAAWYANPDTWASIGYPGPPALR